MNEFERRADHLLNQTWLQGDVHSIDVAVKRIAKRRRRAEKTTLAVLLVLSTGAAAMVATRSERPETGDASLRYLTPSQQQAFACAAALPPPSTVGSVPPPSTVAVRPAAIVTIMMAPGARADQVSAVRVASDQNASVAKSTYYDRTALFARYNEVVAIAPEMAGVISESMVSTLVILELRNGVSEQEVDELAAVVRSLPGVERVGGTSVEPLCNVSDPTYREVVRRVFDRRWGNGVDVIVFIESDVTVDRLEAVRAQINADPDVVSADFWSPAQSMEDFRCMFANEPDLLASVDANVLPPSFRLDVGDRSEGKVGAVVERYRQQAGVKEAVPKPDFEEYARSGVVGRSVSGTPISATSCQSPTGRTVR